MNPRTFFSRAVTNFFYKINYADLCSYRGSWISLHGIERANVTLSQPGLMRGLSWFQFSESGRCGRSYETWYFLYDYTTLVALKIMHSLIVEAFSLASDTVGLLWIEPLSVLITSRYTVWKWAVPKQPHAWVTCGGRGPTCSPEAVSRHSVRCGNAREEEK